MHFDYHLRLPFFPVNNKMPDLANLSAPSHLSLDGGPNSKPLSPDQSELNSVDAAVNEPDLDQKMPSSSNGGCIDGVRVFTRRWRTQNGAKMRSDEMSLENYVKAWIDKKKESGVPESRCFLPFLVGAKKSAECLICHRCIYPGEEVLCGVRSCKAIFHLSCAQQKLRVSNLKDFKCPQHLCFICNQRPQWRCIQCTLASHDKCAAWPNKVIHLQNQPGRALCWRHPSDWRQDEHMVASAGIEEVFSRLPVPYVDEEFKIELTWRELTENNVGPAPYVHIKRNVYMVKKKRDASDDGIGCINCTSLCSKDCFCRVQCISCSKFCRCSETCTNRPFRRVKKIKIVKTELCGWGVEAAEPIDKGDFIIEYIGEVIDDALCEKRLWDMKYKGVQNFYMCEIRKDFTIDATFKGNTSRFLNHSCDPNCVLEKWQIDGETRVGVFAARSIKVGEALTYDYRFVQFGPEVKCHCGASNCQGYLGTKRKAAKFELCWGSKRKRTRASLLTMRHVTGKKYICR
ncbi:histone-lysine N-methyltransferase ASHR3 isoform X2 [Tripterygium wilfordii]|uniref:histone-lysine N-methyltransferase ASHR3 isoform X2 n=1 Tax=Tripterygium wilfordii TaxID=458696 RepID=UPI0018F81CAE|nr:histone-lysine N-methyltransferase ASHR3 isoform X2 [Tripterygium wilfordii]